MYPIIFHIVEEGAGCGFCLSGFLRKSSVFVIAY